MFEAFRTENMATIRGYKVHWFTIERFLKPTLNADWAWLNHKIHNIVYQVPTPEASVGSSPKKSKRSCFREVYNFFSWPVLPK